MGRRPGRPHVHHHQSRRHAGDGRDLRPRRRRRLRRGDARRVRGASQVVRADRGGAGTHSQQGRADPRVPQGRVGDAADPRGRQDLDRGDRRSRTRGGHLPFLRRTQLHGRRPDDSARPSRQPAADPPRTGGRGGADHAVELPDRHLLIDRRLRPWKPPR